MSHLSQNQMSILLNDINSEDNFDRLFDVIFSNDYIIDHNLLVSFLQERYSVIAPSLSDGDKESINTYINELSSDLDELNYFLIKIQRLLIDPDEHSLMLRLDHSAFWTFFAISIKKCVSSPSSKIENTEDYYSQVTTNTSQQEKAHQKCIAAFNLNSDKFSLRTDPMLKLFLHSFHSRNKRIKTRKKNLHRVLKKTKKIMQAKKINDRTNSNYNIFIGKTYIIPEEFAKYIVKRFIVLT